MTATRIEIFVGCVLAATTVAWGVFTYTQYKPSEPDPAQTEYEEYVQKSPEHRYAFELLTSCGSKPFVLASDCVYMAVGKATYEKNGEYGQAVADAIRDIGEHMTAWKKEHANDGK